MTPSSVQRVRARLGDGVVLLSVAKRRKNPTLHGWEKLRIDVMNNRAYLRTLESGNIGVLLGSPSGGLCAVDFDTDADAARFMSKNPRLDGALRTCGARGFQIWVQIEGDFPPSSDAKDRDGRKVAEWRADGRQSIIWGTHPSGQEYAWLVDAPPVRIAFDAIHWPEGWRGKWMPEPEPPAATLLTDKPLALDGVIILPSGGVGILACAQTVFSILARTRRVFIRGGTVVEVVNDPTGANRGLVLEPVHPAGFRTAFPGSGAVRACSAIENIEIGPATSVYGRFRRLGVYRWEDIAKITGGDENAPIMAVRFVNTEPFVHPVAWSRLAGYGVRGSVQGPTKITPDVFAKLYRTGMNL